MYRWNTDVGGDRGEVKSTGEGVVTGIDGDISGGG